MTTENERARQYRIDQQKQRDYRLAQERSLRGNETTRRLNLRRWAPLLHWPGWNPKEHIEGDTK